MGLMCNSFKAKVERKRKKRMIGAQQPRRGDVFVALMIRIIKERRRCDL